MIMQGTISAATLGFIITGCTTGPDLAHLPIERRSVVSVGSLGSPRMSLLCELAPFPIPSQRFAIEPLNLNDGFSEFVSKPLLGIQKRDSIQSTDYSARLDEPLARSCACLRALILRSRVEC
jgi:hypothetical protein